MKIVEIPPETSEFPVIEIMHARYLGDFAIRIIFNDGTERLVDFKPFLTESRNPLIKRYQDENRFKEFQLIDGNLNWHDYDLIFPIYDLYEGKIA